MDLLDDRIRDWVGQQKAKLEPSADHPVAK